MRLLPAIQKKTKICKILWVYLLNACLKTPTVSNRLVTKLTSIFIEFSQNFHKKII